MRVLILTYMGGNIRHGNKGSDRSKTICEDCGKNFTHGKFTHFTYCPECREERQSNADLKSNVRIENSSENLKVVVELTNNSDVNVNVPIKRVNKDNYDNTFQFGVVGNIRLESENWSCEDVIIKKSRYGNIKLKSNTTRTYEFIIKDSETTQKNKPKTKYHTLGEELRNDVKKSRGNVNPTDTIAVLFEPVAEASDHLKKSADSVKTT